MKYIHTPDAHNMQSASEIVPVLNRKLTPGSVLDVGCGLGDFLKVFQGLGVRDVLGLDGSWVKPSQLFIDSNSFQATDLESSFDLGRRYDLALCLEVAEHLAFDKSECLVENLCRHADTIVFSAAIPGQGGQNHVNEQSFDFWFKKFEQNGYTVIDNLRHAFWFNKKVQWWYRQNMFLITKRQDLISENSNYIISSEIFKTVVHPDYLAEKNLLINELKAKIVQLESTLDAMQHGRFTWRTYRKAVVEKLKLQWQLLTKSNSTVI